MFIEYPKWKYHDTEPACLVEDAEAEAALGDGWRDKPEAEPVKPAKKAKGA